MGNKSKKSKPAQPADVTGQKPRDNDEAVRNIYRRLRKGADLKSLSKEAESLETIKSSAINCLCRAKVDLSLAADVMRDKSLFEPSKIGATASTYREIRDKLIKVIQLACRGAVLHNSLLCGLLCAKLAQLLNHKPEDFELSRKIEELQDPNSELVEQARLCCV